MSTIVGATLPAAEFALKETLEHIAGAEFEIVRMAAPGTNRVMPLLWATADDFESLPATLEKDPSTENVETLSTLEQEYLLRMDWTADIRIIHYILVEERATILHARGRNGEWQFRILFPEHDSVGDTYEFCAEYDIDIQLDRIYQLSESGREHQFGLTPNQYETLISAYEAGYYEIPRAVNLEELANRLGVSHQALSERLRRGHRTLVTNTLKPEAAPTDNDRSPTAERET